MSLDKRKWALVRAVTLVRRLLSLEQEEVPEEEGTAGTGQEHRAVSSGPRGPVPTLPRHQGQGTVSDKGLLQGL